MSVFQQVVDMIEEDRDISFIEDVTDLVYIGGGNDRIVFEMDDGKVVKFLKKGKPSLQNRQEVDYWFEYNEDLLGRYLAEVYNYSDDYRWVVMENCQSVGKEEAKEFYSFLEGEGIKPLDDHPDNVGRTGDQYKLVDYGHRIIINY